MQVAGLAQPAVIAVGVALGRVVGVRAALTQGRQIVIGIIGRVVVQVRHGEHDDAAGYGMRPTVGGVAPFAAVAGALVADALADGGPIFRVAVLHRWVDRQVNLPGRTARLL